jgi:hypothetical protein
MPLPLAQLQDRLSDRLRPWKRSAEFWVRAADIYTSYKVRRAPVRWLAASSCSISTSLRGAC